MTSISSDELGSAGVLKRHTLRHIQAVDREFGFCLLKRFESAWPYSRHPSGTEQVALGQFCAAHDDHDSFVECCNPLSPP